MTNIVARLRAIYATHPMVMEAAEEIERLNKDGADMAAIIRQQGFEIERLRTDYSILKADYDALREALTEISRVGSVDRACNIANRALEPTP